ncbi:hypothetical protein F3087_16990 [Nocardia colli]|uniref:Uncharacterized protein n=1 Tax=Nocardia colli TaxID=2545717 RepID=A0A5N0EEN2_9NOCA|nr:hypothetical protein [Nocardia colli]KAA8887393.1 hypothetical protein F3087_16990 [Nocardia colli]
MDVDTEEDNLNMLATRSSALAILAMAAAVFLGITASHADAYPEDVEQKKAAAAYQFVCEDGGSAPRSYEWYRQYAKIQDTAPYEVRGNVRIFSTVAYQVGMDNDIGVYRFITVREDNTRAYNPKSREKLCTNSQQFLRWNQRVISEYKEGIKACCATERGMEEFFEWKIDAVLALNEQQAEALDDEDGYREKYKETDPDFKFLNMWSCKEDDSSC